MKGVGKEGFINEVRERLKSGLPGQAAHLRMIPTYRIPEFNMGNGTGKPSAVLLLLYPGKEFISCVFIQRPEYDGYHSGQISLPGGKFDAGDKDLIQTALREASEEVGIDPDKVEVMGQLTNLFIPPSSFLLSPFVAFQDHRPAFIADQREVAAILEIDIRNFSVAHRKEKDISLHSGRIIRTPYYDVDGHVIWGATAMIMSEFEVLTEGLF